MIIYSLFVLLFPCYEIQWKGEPKWDLGLVYDFVQTSYVWLVGFWEEINIAKVPRLSCIKVWKRKAFCKALNSKFLCRGEIGPTKELR